MSGSTSSRLPTVGMNFASLFDFKIAAYTAAKNGPFRMRIFDSHSGKDLLLRCDGRGGKGELDPCTCSVRAVKTQSGTFAVKRADEQHSCTLPPPGSYKARMASIDMGARLEKARMEEEERCAKLKQATQRASATGEEGVSTMGGGEEEEQDEEEEEEVAAVTGSSPIPSPSTSKAASHPAPRTPRVKKKTGSSAKRKRPPLAPSSGPRHPLSKLLLVEDFERMAKGRKLTLPDTLTFFPNARSLLVHIYAYAHQQNLPLVHSPSSPRRIALICKPIPLSPRCCYEVVIREEDDGRWHVAWANLKHDSGMHAKAGLALGPEKPSLTKTPAASASSPSTRKRLLPSSPLSPVVKTKKTPQTPSPKLKPNEAAPSPAQPPQPLSLPDLLAFSAACLPSFDDPASSSLTKFLTDLGIETVDDFAAFLQVDEGTLFHLVEDVKEKMGWSPAQALEVVELLVVGRSSLEAEGEV